MGMLRKMRLASALLTVVLLVQVSRVLSSGSLQYRSIHGTYEVRCPDDSYHRLLLMNGGSVDGFILCRGFRFLKEKLCFVEGYVRYRFSGMDIPLGRKLLQEPVREEGSTGHELIRETHMIAEKSARSTLLTTKSLAMAMPVMFVLSCALLCPCFRARRKEYDHSVIAKELSSSDKFSAVLSVGSVSSTEISSEKFPGSPRRVLPIPLRVPPSSLRVPPSPRFSMSPQLNRNGSVHLDVSQVARATRNFSQSFVIGEGGFGIVYKAKLQDGRAVAIKRAKKGKFHAIRTEFRSEVELLSKIDHRNLVKLLGYIDRGNERLIITEYVANGTLREHLDGMRDLILDFKQRLEISIDVAHGLTYLHMYADEQIIHRDVKSSNILLTDSMKAKVADFGFARLGDADSEKLNISTKVKGTVGYLDPEYMRTFHLTPKSDVYSFGVLLLEILTSRRPVELKRPVEERVTLLWAFKKYNEGNFDALLDPLMNESVDHQILERMFGLAIQCAAPTQGDRPDMKSVGEQLWGIRKSYLRSGV